MLSRVADSIYWLSRYVERVENLARFIDVTLLLMLDMPDGSTDPWQPLVYASGDHEYFAKHYSAASQETVIRFLTFDPDYPHSIISCLHRARENARSVREAISSEMWEHINTFYFTVMDAALRDAPMESPHEFFREVRMASHLFRGITDATLTQSEGYHFAQLGSLLERADKTSRLLDVKYFILLPTIEDVGTSIDDLQWSAVLRSLSGFEMYRKQHHGLAPSRVVQFLVLDRHFPRAIHHCLIEAEKSLHAISGTPPDTFRNAAERRLGRLRSELAYTHIDDIVARGVHEFLDDLQTKLNGVGDAIFENFFAMRTPTQTAGMA